jgi:hypothetical protein
VRGGLDLRGGPGEFFVRGSPALPSNSPPNPRGQKNFGRASPTINLQAAILGVNYSGTGVSPVHTEARRDKKTLVPKLGLGTYSPPS